MKDMIINSLAFFFGFLGCTYAYFLGKDHGRREILDKVGGWIRGWEKKATRNQEEHATTTKTKTEK